MRISDWSSDVCSSDLGRAARIPTTHNLLGFPDGISGEELLSRMREHAARYGAELVNGVVKSIERVQTGFIVRTDSQAIEGRTILLAQGVLNHQPRIPQETHDRGVDRKSTRMNSSH